MSDVRVNIKGLEQFRDQLEKLDVSAFCQAAAKELAARLLRMVIKNTPVDTGTLRSGWKASNISVKKDGDNYTVEIVNNTKYASYVEYGHRTANHSGWVEGNFAMTMSEDKIRNTAPKILETKLNKWLREVYK